LGPPIFSATVEIWYTQIGFGTSLPKRRLGPKLAGSDPGKYPEINWDPLRISATVEASNFKFGTRIGFGTSLPKTTLRTKIGGGLGRGSIQTKLGIPYVFLQPLKLATSILVHNLGFGTSLQKTFRIKIGRYLGRGASKKTGDPYLFLQPSKLAGVWARGATEKNCDPLFISGTD